MGAGNIKPPRSTTTSTRRPTTTMTPEQEALDRIRRTLRKDLDTFLLNNILLSVQFFENFDRELATLRGCPSGERDMERSAKLAQHHRHCLSPDRLYDVVAKRVRFRSRQLLHDPRLFVVQYNVDVVEEDTDYSALHHPDAYRFNIEDSDKAGYVKLRAEDNMTSRRRDMYEDEAIYSSGSSHYEKARITPQEEEEIREIISELPGSSKRSKLGPPAHSLPNLAPRGKHSVSSGYKSMGSSPAPLSESSDYSYTTVRELTKPRPLAELSLGSVPREEGQIPARCFSSQVLPDYNNPGGYQTRYYLNSNTYMHSFVEEFSVRLGEKLGFSQREMEMAIQQAARVVCSTDGKRTDVIPALHCPSWPESAKEWYSRARRRFPDSRPGAVHGWPSQRTLEDIQSLGCHLVPFGFTPTRGRNSEHHLEWRIAYPTAERRLECCLSHPQVRCLMFTLALYRTFLEPPVDGDVLGLLPSHIRTLLFWQCETHPFWPEDRLGEILRKFLDKLYYSLKRRRLPDYFIPSHNLFQGIPHPDLLIGQSKLSEMRENLVMHLLVALCNLNYVNDDFYPVLDYRRLYRIITTDNLAGLLNPKLRHVQNTRTKHSDTDSSSDEEESQEERDKQREWNKAARRKQERRATNQSSEKHKNSGENIDIKVQPKKGAELSRKTALLDFFIPHFIKLARKSNTFRATRQAHMYLQHAERLSKLLAECEGDSASFDRKSRLYLIEIKKILQAMGPVPSSTDPNFSLRTTSPVPELSEISGPTKLLRSNLNSQKLSLDIHNSKSAVPTIKESYKQTIRTENVNSETYVPQFRLPQPKPSVTKSVSVNSSVKASNIASQFNTDDIMPYEPSTSTDKPSASNTIYVLNNAVKDTQDNMEEVCVTVAQVHATQEMSPDANKESKFTFEEKLEEESTDL